VARADRPRAASQVPGEGFADLISHTTVIKPLCHSPEYHFATLSMASIGNDI
jgi:hypothetical protein